MQGLDAQRLVQGTKASWSSDGTEIVYGIMPYGAGLELLDPRTRQSRRLTHTGKDPAFCPIGPGLIAYVRSHNYDEEIWVVDTQGENDRKIAAGGFPCWSADGQTLYFQSRKDWKIRAVEMSDRSEPNPQLTVVHELPKVWYPAVSPDGRWIAYAHGAQFVLVNLTSGQKTSRELRGRGGLAGWSPDSRLVGYGGYGSGADAGLWVLEVDSGELKQLAQGDYTMPAWSHDGTKIAFDSRDAHSKNEIWLVDAKIRKSTGPYQPPPDQSTLPASSVAEPLTTGPDSEARVVDQPERTWQVAPERQRYFTATFNFDGTRIAAPDAKLVKVWSVADGEVLLSLGTSQAQIFDVAFSPDGKWVAGAGEDGVIVWNAASGQEIARPKREKAVTATRVTFSPDSEFLLAGRMGGATLWRTESWDLHFDMPCKRSWLCGVSFSSDGETFAVCGQQNDFALHRINGDLLRIFEGYGSVHHTLVVNPAGKTLAVTGVRDLAVFDLLSGAYLYVLAEQNENVVAFSSDGMLLATATDRPRPVVVVRDAADGRERIRLRGHATKLNSAVFSPDSQRLVSASDDGAIMLWQLPSHERQPVPSPP